MTAFFLRHFKDDLFWEFDARNAKHRSDWFLIIIYFKNDFKRRKKLEEMSHKDKL